MSSINPCEASHVLCGIPIFTKEVLQRESIEDINPGIPLNLGIHKRINQEYFIVANSMVVSPIFPDESIIPFLERMSHKSIQTDILKRLIRMNPLWVRSCDILISEVARNNPALLFFPKQFIQVGIVKAKLFNDLDLSTALLLNFDGSDKTAVGEVPLAQDLFLRHHALAIADISKIDTQELLDQSLATYKLNLPIHLSGRVHYCIFPRRTSKIK